MSTISLDKEQFNLLYPTQDINWGKYGFKIERDNLYFNKSNLKIDICFYRWIFRYFTFDFLQKYYAQFLLFDNVVETALGE